MVARYRLTLFVTPDNSGKALAHLYRALEDLRYDDYELVMVDVLQEPDKAQKVNVIGTPALVYHAPGGDVLIHHVCDHESIRQALEIERV